MPEEILDRLLESCGDLLCRHSPEMVVAIPAKNEERQLGTCLTALAAQQGIVQGGMGVVLLVNNSDDGTAALARSLSPLLPFPLIVAEADLPEATAHAGMARRLAMDLAAVWLGPMQPQRRLLLTTDADSRVAPDWAARTRAAAAKGADAVAGTITLDPEDELTLSPQLRERSRREAAYEAILVEIASLLDPRPHDPWPRHDTASGASLAATMAAYRAIGGLPAVPLGEDRALARALDGAGWCLRHDPLVRVITSGRLEGRARGGAADTMRLRNGDPTAPCDPRLERLGRAMRRARWRGLVRRLHAGAEGPTVADLAHRLKLEQSRVDRALRSTSFGECWERLEAASPLLAPWPVRPEELPEQILLGQAALLPLRTQARLRRDGAADPGGRPACALAAGPA